MFRRKGKEDAGEKTGQYFRKRQEVLCSVSGTREINLENYGSLGDFSEEKIVLNGYKCRVVIEGKRLRIDYFTDVDMRITGKIESIHF